MLVSQRCMYHAVHCEKRSSDLDLAETERVVQYRPNKPTRIGQSYCLLSRTFCIFMALRVSLNGCVFLLAVVHGALNLLLICDGSFRRP